MLLRSLFYVFMAVFLIPGTLQSQEFQTGLVDDPVQYDLVARTPTNGAKSGELPMKLDLSIFAPTPGHQGSIGSCVGWAAAYAALTICHAQKNNWSQKEINENAFSSLFLYNQIKIGGCSSGTTLQQAASYLQVGGAYVSSNSYDSPRTNCDKLPTAEQKKQAKSFVLQDYLALFDSDADPKVKIFNTKKSLADSIPVVFGMEIRRNFFKPIGETWNPEEGNTMPAGGHAMCAVGFNEGRRAFKVINSWGDKWANDGYIWINYSDFAKYVKYGYQYIIHDEEVPVEDIPDFPDLPDLPDKPIDPVNPTPNDPKPQPEPSPEVVVKAIGGKFEFRIPVVGDGDDIAFDNVALKYSEGYYYELEKTDWGLGDMFQFVINGVKKKRYVYSFSLDNTTENGGLNMHYPRDFQLPKSREATMETPMRAGESPIIMNQENIVIPNEESALTKREAGADRIVVLYSTAPIKDFGDRVVKLKGAQNNFNDAFTKAFGDICIPVSDIKYDKDKIAFRAVSKKNLPVVPVIVTVRGK